MDKTGSILQEADRLVSNARAEDYGDASEGFRLAARIAAVITPKDAPIAEECIYFMIALKLARHHHKIKRDNLVDAVGYLALLAEEQGL